MKIISGGQSGADLSGNYFAKKYGIETEINAFECFKPKYDKLPDDIKINYVCNKNTYVANLRCRTLYNVRNSDFTIILLRKPIEYTKGSKLTLEKCKKLHKNCLYVNIINNNGEFWLNKEILLGGKTYLGFNVNNLEDAKEIVKSQIIKPQIINVAGERDLNSQICIEFLEKLFEEEVINNGR